MLTQIRQTIGEYNFAVQYQQPPAPREGGMVKRDWFKHYTPAEMPSRFDQVVQSWDTANKPTELSDYSVCTTWGQVEKHLYLINVLRKKLDYPGLKRAVREQADLHGAQIVLIEDKASGTQLIKAYQPPAGMDKRMRLHAQTGVIENGFVHLPHKAEWLDIPDASTRGRSSGPGRFCRAREQAGADGRPVAAAGRGDDRGADDGDGLDVALGARDDQRRAQARAGPYG